VIGDTTNITLYPDWYLAASLVFGAVMLVVMVWWMRSNR
jgi:hypothetical protein